MSYPFARPRAAAVLVACTSLLADCRTPNTGSKVDASGADAYKGFVTLFTNVIGRKPTQGSDGGGNGDFALFDADADKMVDNLLASPQYVQDGFFNVHRDRLMLQLYQQSATWIRSQHASYCALKREMQDVAREDVSGKGYWQLLSYQDRWVPIPPTVTGCFVGASVADLRKVMDAGGNPSTGGAGSGPVGVGTTPVGVPPPAPTAIPPVQGAGGLGLEDAVAVTPGPGGVDGTDSSLPPDLPGSGSGSGSVGTATVVTAPTGSAGLVQSCSDNRYNLGDVNAYVQALDSVPQDQQAKAFIDTPQGQQALAAFLTQQIKPQGTAATDVNVRFTTDQSGALQLTEEKDPAPESISCTFGDLPENRATWQPQPTSTVLVRAKVSPKVAGYWANPYWLARHPTTVKNRQMHRARVVMYSFFCKEVSPAAAALAGGNAQVVPELASYFAPGDVHAQASQACYDCHATLQPMGNFFTALNRNDNEAGDEVLGGNGGGPGFGGFTPFRGLDYFQKYGALELPGGYWTFSEPGKGAFFGKEGTHYNVKGIQGLANVLSDPTFVGPAQCVVGAAWSTVFGSEYKMPDAFKAEVLTAFQRGNGAGTPSMTEALRYVLKSQYGKAYFSSADGRAKFEQLLSGTSYAQTCDDATTAAGLTVAQNSCYKCHNSKKKSGGIALFNFGDKVPLATTTDQTRHKAYCEVFTDDMPADGALELADKQKALCWLKPKSEATVQCDGAAPTTPDAPMHPMPN